MNFFALQLLFFAFAHQCGSALCLAFAMPWLRLPFQFAAFAVLSVSKPLLAIALRNTARLHFAIAYRLDAELCPCVSFHGVTELCPCRAFPL
jgi:hypothetical protein